MVKFCQYCKDNFKNEHPNHPYNKMCPGYMHYIEEDAYICPFCNKAMVDINIQDGDFEVLLKTSTDINFLEAMIKLKQDDIVEYNLKMSQFKTQVEQKNAAEQRNVESNTPHCPTCGSTKIEKISATSKVAGAVTFGLFSKTARSQFKCKNCGAKW